MRLRRQRSAAARFLVLVFTGLPVTAAAGQDGGGRVEGDSYLPRRPLVARMDTALRAAFPPSEHGWLWAEPAGAGHGAQDLRPDEGRATRGTEEHAPVRLLLCP